MESKILINQTAVWGNVSNASLSTVTQALIPALSLWKMLKIIAETNENLKRIEGEKFIIFCHISHDFYVIQHLFPYLKSNLIFM